MKSRYPDSYRDLQERWKKKECLPISISRKRYLGLRLFKRIKSNITYY